MELIKLFLIALVAMEMSYNRLLSNPDNTKASDIDYYMSVEPSEGIQANFNRLRSMNEAENFGVTEKEIFPCEAEYKAAKLTKQKVPKVRIFGETHGNPFCEETKKSLLLEADGKKSVLLLEGETVSPPGPSGLRAFHYKYAPQKVPIENSVFGIDEMAPVALGNIRHLSNFVDEYRSELALSESFSVPSHVVGPLSFHLLGPPDERRLICRFNRCQFLRS